jgi:hypothetical protein
MASSKPSKKMEDDYFARQEYDRIKKQQEEKAAKMAEEEKTKLKELHWMHCPKCGTEMVEIDYEGITLDKCPGCMGLYFDNGELDLLLNKQSGFRAKFFSIFKD